MHMSDHIKMQIKGKMQERARLEATILECTTRLETAGAGLHSKLIDEEGFPRADVDVSAVRADRQQVAVSTNDHKRLTNQIEQLMHELHAEARKAPALDAAKRIKTTDGTSSLTVPAQSVTQSAAQSAAMMTSSSVPVKRPFAVIDELSAASPAQEAGLQIGDQLVSFADITAQTANTLPTIAAALQALLADAVSLSSAAGKGESRGRGSAYQAWQHADFEANATHLGRAWPSGLPLAPIVMLYDAQRHVSRPARQMNFT